MRLWKSKPISCRSISFYKVFKKNPFLLVIDTSYKAIWKVPKNINQKKKKYSVLLPLGNSTIQFGIFVSTFCSMHFHTKNIIPCYLAFSLTIYVVSIFLYGYKTVTVRIKFFSSFKIPLCQQNCVC